MNRHSLSKYCFYLWLLVWPWQTKIIIFSAPVNYLEISFFLSWFLLLIPAIIWGRRIFAEDYWRFKKGKTKPWWWLSLIILEFISFCSIFWAENMSLVLFKYLILVLGILVFYLSLRIDFVKVSQTLNFFLLGLIAPAILGIWQFFSQSTFANKYLGLAYHSASILGDSIVETGTGRYLRAYGSFDHPNILGGMMALALLLILYLSLKKEISQKARLFLLSSFAIFYLALLASFSRTGILAFFISAPFLIFYAWRQGIFQRKLITLFIFLIVSISTVFILSYKDLFFGRFEVQGRLEQKSISERVVYINQAETLITEKPFQGVGAGNYILGLQKIIPGQETWSYQPVHNYCLLIWGELGLFGLLATLVFWFSIIKSSVKKHLWPLGLALIIISLLDHWLWTQPLGLIIFFLLASLMIKDDF